MTGIWIILLVLVILLWLPLVGNLATINNSDPAGNGLSKAYGVFMAIALWILMALLLVVAGVKGQMPMWAGVLAFLLAPASGAATLAAIELLSDRTFSRWPILIPALVPPLIAAFAIWAYVPSIHAAIPANLAGAIVWGTVLCLAISPWPSIAKRSGEGDEHRAKIEAAYQAESAKRKEQDRQEKLARFQKLTYDAPLWEWRDFADPESELREQALEGMRHVKSRQADAEELLAHGLPFPMRELSNLALEATPALCESARRFLRKKADSMKPNVAGAPPYDVIADLIEPYLPTMTWLTQKHCECADELDGINQIVRVYRDSPERDKFLAALDQIRQQH